jgi:hypothetical protein
MSEKQVVVYTARNKQQAHLLKNLLEESGIEAVVSGDVLSDGTGVDAVGWATAARVVVAEEDAAAARGLAEEFDRRGAEPTGPLEFPEPEPDELTEWPTCPECGARRTTTCPVCHTPGTDFPEADPHFAALPELEEGAQPVSSCGCGSGGCRPGEGQGAEPSGSADSQPAGPAEPLPGDESAAGEEESGLMLMCTICDEPFRAEFPNRCEWCGHEFPDGYPVDVTAEGPVEEVTTRALAVMIVLGLLGIGLAAYFLFLVPGS